MRKIVFHMSVSLDGYMEGPGHDLSWHRVDDELHQYMNDTLREAGGFLSGRVLYELMADFWPTADQDPEASPVMVEFAGIWRDMPKTCTRARCGTRTSGGTRPSYGRSYRTRFAR